MPMKKSYFLLLAVLLWGCSTFEEEVLPAPGDSPRQLSVSAVEEPGPDPGSLEIMQRAVDSVAAHSGQRSRSASVSGAQIELPPLRTFLSGHESAVRRFVRSG